VAQTAATPGPTTVQDVFAALRSNVETVLQGKGEVVHLALVCLLAGGHLLIEDVPGVGKTSLAKAVARSVEGGTWRRIQFTPDLLPSDVTGVAVWNQERSEFRFRPGGVFANVVLADEINRASPKTQSALLEAMEERHVSVDGVTHPLPRPFMVIATQNPIELQGTFPLPEAQLDRFLMRITLGYPDREAEHAILESHGGHDLVDSLEPVVGAELFRAATALVDRVHVAPSVREYLVELAAATRSHPDLLLGLSPRGTLGLQQAARALAAAAGRDYVIPDDVKHLVPSVVPHRLVLGAEARLSGLTTDGVVADLLDGLPVPLTTGGA